MQVFRPSLERIFYVASSSLFSSRCGVEDTDPDCTLVRFAESLTGVSSYSFEAVSSFSPANFFRGSWRLLSQNGNSGSYIMSNARIKLFNGAWS